MQNIVEIGILLYINSIIKSVFQLCPRIVPEILRVLIFCADGGGPGDKILKVRPRFATGAHRVLTIEVWHQTSGGKGTNNL